MFDRSLLPEALFEFVVVADTHFMLDPGGRKVEFNSRRLQTPRVEAALRMIAALEADFVVHLGDLVQEFPEREAFGQAMDEAVAQLRRCGVQPRLVAGNHDVGDKPDPTMPTEPVTPDSLADYHERFGSSWYGFDRHGCHFAVLNSQILNTGLPDERAQRAWLENDLAEHASERLFLFLHLPPYLWDAEEPSLGHYDNLGEPARGWLLDLIRRYEVELLFAAHVHFAFFDRVGKTRYWVAGSTSFTRPGFCHLFDSAPPADHGRDDAEKLGFYLVRVRNDRSDVHFIRTAGIVSPSASPQSAPETPDHSECPPSGAGTAGHRPSEPDSQSSVLWVVRGTERDQMITRISGTVPRSPLGITLSRPLSGVTEIPVAWPSAIRQKVRNDYPLLSCLELGATAVRVPASDLADPLASRRLEILRDEGVQVTATSLWPTDWDVGAFIQRHAEQVDGWEFQLTGAARLTAEQIACLQENRPYLSSLHLSAVIPHETIAGKQHPRTRHGFLPGEVDELNRQLSEADVRIGGALCRIGGDRSPWDEIQAAAGARRYSHVEGIHCSLDVSTTDDRLVAELAADALFGMSLLPGSWLFVDPLVDFDRTMDVRHGLLDTLCNPRPAFHVLRCLNTVLAHAQESLPDDARASADGFEQSGWKVRVLQTAVWVACLLHPPYGKSGRIQALPRRVRELFSSAERVRTYHLGESSVTDGVLDEAALPTEPESVSPALAPMLLLGWKQNGGMRDEG